MLRSTTVLAVAFSLSVWATAPLAAAEAPPPLVERHWLRVTTPHFRVLGDVDRSQAVDIARRLERLREVLDRLQPEMQITNAEQLQVYALDGEPTFRWFKLHGVESLAGYCLSRPEDIWLVINAQFDRNERDVVTMLHEFTHAYFHSRFQSLPLWLNEGLAQYYSTFDAGDRTAEIGRALPGAREWLRAHARFDFERLFEVTGDSPQYRSGESRGTFYYESWALVSMLIERADSDSGKFYAFMNRMLGGQYPMTAFTTVYPRETWRSLEQELNRFIQSTEHSYTKYTFERSFEPAATTVEQVATPAVLVAGGDLMLALSESDEPTLERATACYHAALESEPSNARALAGLGLIEDRAGRTAAAESLYSVANVADPEDAEVCLIGGRGVMERLERQARSGADAKARARMVRWARQRFTCAVHRDPTRVAALIGYGRAACLDPEGPADPLAVRALTAAFQARRDRVDLLWSLLDLAERAGRQAAVDSVIAVMRTRIPEAEIEQWEQHHALEGAYASFQRGVQAFNNERYDEAEVAFQEAMQNGDAQIRQQSETHVRMTRARSAIARAYTDLAAGRALQAETFLDSLLASAALDTVRTPELRTEHEYARHLRADASFQRWSDAGIAYARAGKTEAARTAFRKALEQARDDERKNYARRMLQQLGEPAAPRASKSKRLR